MYEGLQGTKELFTHRCKASISHRASDYLAQERLLVGTSKRRIDALELEGCPPRPAYMHTPVQAYGIWAKVLRRFCEGSAKVLRKGSGITSTVAQVSKNGTLEGSTK